MSGFSKASALLRRVLPYLAIAIVVAIAYDGSIFYSRWRDALDGEKATVAKEARDDSRIADAYGGDHLKILNFYASPATVRPGQKSLICYGVNAAESVRLDPPVEQLHPAISNCFDVTPRRDTEYKLTVTDHAGHMLTQNLSIHVAP